MGIRVVSQNGAFMPMAKPGQDFRGEQKWGRCSRQREKHGTRNVHTRAVPPSKSGLLPTCVMSHAEFTQEKPAKPLKHASW